MMQMPARRFRPYVATLVLLAAGPVLAQLRVVTWNITSYNGGQVSDIQVAVYGTFEGRSLSPDIILGQEFQTASAITEFRNALNSASGSPGDWDAAGYVSGSDCAFFFRTAKVQMLGSPQPVAYDPNLPQPPRKAVRYLVQLQGYSSTKARLACYGSHMKAGTTGDDRNKRLTEAIGIRTNAQALNPDYGFLLGGDLNVYTSQEDAYQYLIGSQENNHGQFFDPISTPGAWNNNIYFRFVHTQDPVYQMDDRFDQILVSDTLIDGEGLDYIGQYGVPYSTTTWNDANHSYRAWGNDGTTFDAPLRITGNSMVGPVIAQAIKNLAGSGGHVPAYLDLRVPAEIGSDPALDFGPVLVGATAEQPLHVWNDGNVPLWTAAGIADLAYTLVASPGFTAPPGPFSDAAGGGVNTHVITMDTSSPGIRSGTLTISSNAPDEPARVVTLTGEVVAGTSTGDLNCDGVVDFDDISPFIMALSDPAAYQAAFPDCNWLNGDCNQDGNVDFDDINGFVALLSR